MTDLEERIANLEKRIEEMATIKDLDTAIGMTHGVTEAFTLFIKHVSNSDAERIKAFASKLIAEIPKLRPTNAYRGMVAIGLEGIARNLIATEVEKDLIDESVAPIQERARKRAAQPASDRSREDWTVGIALASLARARLIPKRVLEAARRAAGAARAVADKKAQPSLSSH
jgi:hypothetical protein